jgi:hypothetical protein
LREGCSSRRSNLSGKSWDCFAVKSAARNDGILNIFDRLLSWCAYIAAGATIFGFITFVVFFIVGDPFGIMNDVASVVIALTSIPILIMLHTLHRTGSIVLSWTALLVGIASLIVAAITQTMLVLKIIKYEQTIPATIGFGIFGVSLMLYGYLSYTQGTFTRNIAVWGILAGLGYFLVIVGFLLGQQNHPLTYIGGLMSVIAFPVWTIMLGKHWLNSK